MSLRYIDYDLDLGTDLSDFGSIKQALAILFGTDKLSLPFNRSLGTNLKRLLFDYPTQATQTLLKSEVEFTLSKFFSHSDILFNVEVTSTGSRVFSIEVTFDYLGVKDSFLYSLSSDIKV